MKKSILRATAAWQVVAMAGAGLAASTFLAAPALAQDYTSGSLSGTVRTAAGGPVSGATVTVTSIQQGNARRTTTNAQGVFSVSSLPTGDYDVVVKAAGSPSSTVTGVSVVPGRTTDIPVQIATGGADGGAIVVTGRRIQAFTGTTSGLNVDVANLTKTVPVSRDLTSVILLAPGTSKGDSAFGNLASVGGASVAENAYYINGLNITNFDNYLGSATVPFDFYKSIEVKSGGYPAEFGRATGGIINSVTKSGTNDWMAAAHVNWAPEQLRSNGKDVCSVADCSLVTSRGSAAYDRSLNTTVEAGGPIFRDRLFVYGLLQLNAHHYQSVDPVAGTAFRYKNDSPFWGVKVDAYPLENHHFELTVFDTRNTTERSDVAYSEVGGKQIFGLANATTAFHGGGVNFVGKYTGRLTNFLTVSGAYGRMRDRFDYEGIAGAAGLPLVQNRSGGLYNGQPNNGYYTGQRIGSLQSPYNTERKFWRADADVNVNLVGAHHFRFGMDNENDKLVEATVRSGRDFLCTGGYLTTAACTAGLSGGGVNYFVRAGGRVEVNYYNSGGSFTQKNQAIYLEDEWKPTNRLTISAGVRRDNFKVTNAEGADFAVLKNNWAPRVGATYTMWGDRSGTLKAFFGQYFLPFASNTAFRNVGGEYYFRERYNIAGFDTNGIPILGTQITNRGDYQSACPFLLTPSSSGQYCSVTANGKVPSSESVIDRNLKATKEQEMILGYEQRWHGWKFGITGTYRKLLRESEDSAIDAAVLKYCDAQGISGCSSYYTGFAQYVINNPGSPITVNLPGVPGNPLVTLTTAQLGYPKAKRTYKAVDFTFDRPYDGVWSLGGSYTLAYSKGNSEGFVQSDFGQSDAGITQDFDQPGFIPGSTGYLPSDRRHHFKLYGAYTFWKALTVGANVNIESPRPESCFGFNPTDLFANVYGAASHYCKGVLSPRGTALKSQWLKQLDAKVAYLLTLPSGLQMNLHADVFNVFNSRSITKRYEFGDLDITTGPNGLPNSYIPDPQYGLATNYQAPRYVRLGVDIMFGGARQAPPPLPPVVMAPPPPPPEAPATQTCSDGTLILATAMCPVAAPPPPPPPPPPSKGERG